MRWQHFLGHGLEARNPIPGSDIFVFIVPYRQSLRPTQHPVRVVPRVGFAGRETDYSKIFSTEIASFKLSSYTPHVFSETTATLL
jgi:hypothetical protein